MTINKTFTIQHFDPEKKAFFDILKNDVKVTFKSNVWSFKIKHEVKKDVWSKVKISLLTKDQKVHIEREDWNIFLEKNVIVKNLFLSVIGNFNYYARMVELKNENNNIMIKYEILDSNKPDFNVVNQVIISLQDEPKVESCISI